MLLMSCCLLLLSDGVLSEGKIPRIARDTPGPGSHEAYGRERACDTVAGDVIFASCASVAELGRRGHVPRPKILNKRKSFGHNYPIAITNKLEI